MKNVVWAGSSSGLDGEFQSGSEVDFYIDNVSNQYQLYCRANDYPQLFKW